MKHVQFSWRMAGEAGQGQQVAGAALARICQEMGLFCNIHSDYPSRLRGGLVVSDVSIANRPVHSVFRQINLLFALSQKAFDWSCEDLAKKSLVFFEEGKVKTPEGKQFITIPFEQILRDGEYKPNRVNTLIIGITAELMGVGIEPVELAIKKALGGKEDTIEENKKIALLGMAYAKKHLKPGKFFFRPESVKHISETLLITGNEALALGAVKADCRFYAAYPITPTSSILHDLAAWSRQTGMVVLHCEDEIAGINLAVGAAWAGARAMTGSSAGGMSLMTEGINLAAMSETPVVIIDSQRPGPATGMATWTSQGDLEYMAKSGGDYLRIILAPSTPEDTYYLAQLAFNLSDKFQMPVIILMDKYLSNSSRIVIKEHLRDIEIDRGKLAGNDILLAGNDRFRRYDLAGNGGISPRSFPGQKGGMYLANGNEHNPEGLSIDGFSRSMREAQMKKRYVKLAGLLKDLPKPEWYGPETAKLTIIGWGSVKGIVLEALETLNTKSAKANYMHITAPWPLDKETMATRLKNRKKILVVENNQTGQLADLLQEALGQKFSMRLTKDNGQQFFAEEIIVGAQNALKSSRKVKIGNE